jgi:hypothetical protein
MLLYFTKERSNYPEVPLHLHLHSQATNKFLFKDYEHNYEVARNVIHRLTNEVFTLSLFVCDIHKTSPNCQKL